MTEMLLTGVQEDFDNLIYKFSLKRSYDFQDFTEIWNELKFYYIYCGRPTELEMRFFTQHVLMFAKVMTLNYNTSEFERVGSLYLLHCLYYSQPLLKAVEIRINHADLKALSQFVDYLRPKCFDPVFAFLKLCLDNAFHFVYCDVPKTIEKAGKVDLNALSKINDEGELKEQRQGMIDLVKKAKIDEKEWHSLENDYNSTMLALSQMKIGPNPLQFTTSDFFKNLLFPEKSQTSAEDGETSQEPLKPPVITKRRKQRLLKMMVEGLLTKEEDKDEGAHPDGESLPVLDTNMEF